MSALIKSQGGLEMSYEVDPELASAMAAFAEQASGIPALARGDWQALRETVAAGLANMATLAPPSSGVETATFWVAVPQRIEIELRWYTKKNVNPGSAVVYAHGGGMVGGDINLYDAVVSSYVSETGVPFLSVNYRLAPEVNGTTLAEDVFSGITWLVHHASEVGVNPNRIAVMGDSGGGGPAAGAAILARKDGIPLAKQILIYPMLDDRNVTPGALPPEVQTWTYDNNFTGWNALLGDARGSASVPSIAVPARLTDFAGLAPAYIEVGDLDIFRDESIAYAQGLARAGVPIELHVHLGAPHGFERLVPTSRVAQQALNDRARVLTSI
jgi:acetyl esterase/lipase